VAKKTKEQCAWDCLTTAGSGPRDSALFAYYAVGAGPLLRIVKPHGRESTIEVLSCVRPPFHPMGQLAYKSVELFALSELRCQA